MNRNFKGVWIPKEIWLNEELTWMEKLFFVEIDSLDNEDGCFASNNYFAKFFYLSPQRCSQIINQLIKKKYINARYEHNGKEIKKRVLNIFDRGIKYSKLGIKKRLKGYKEKVKDNNTGNKTSNNKGGFVKPSIAELLEYNKEKNYNIDCEHFWHYWETRGWKMKGGEKMKSWKSAMVTWKKNNFNSGKDADKIKNEDDWRRANGLPPK